VISNRKLGLFGDNPMLDDDVLLTIAENLARLKLSPLLHLKIAAAVVAPLMADLGENSLSPQKNGKENNDAKNAGGENSPRGLSGGQETKRERGHPKGSGHILDARAKKVLHPVRRKEEGSPPRLPASYNRVGHDISVDEQAAAFLKSALADGPLPAADIEELAKGRGIGPNALERAKIALSVSANRLNSAHGNAVHLSLPG
jgi:hypothetical protein